ncbi:MAG: NAD-dependent deacylase [Gemmatimonadota bacterium]|jgi:NAD-dependent deacetylase
MSGDLERARDLLGGAERIAVLTGAGVSAESGVPTFRGAQGLWKSYRPEELATPQAFARDPRLVWEWYAWRRAFIAECMPNAAHTALARLALGGDRATIVTQNVDGLHHRAAEQVAEDDQRPEDAYPLEVHGAIHRDRCGECGRRSPGTQDVDATALETLPRCPVCSGLLRPDVVWFGEALDADVIGAAFEAARAADVCLVVGTSAIVYPAASVPEVTVHAGGAVIEVNPESTPLTSLASVSLRGPAGELVPALLA